MPKKSPEEFIKEVETKGNFEYEVLSTYEGNNIKVLLRHKLCGNEYYVVPYSFLNGRRCPKCKSLKRSSQEYKKEFENIAGSQYSLLTDYINARTKVQIKHNLCNLNFFSFPNRFLKHPSCPKCYIYTRPYCKKKTDEDINREIEEVFAGDYVWVEGKYSGKNSKLFLKHLSCGTIFEKRYHDFINKKSICPTCGNLKLRTIHLKNEETFQQEFDKIAMKEYTLLSKYTKSNEKIQIKHNKCKRVWLCSPNNFLRGSRCPYCRESKGEKKIRNYLEKVKLNFYEQYKFNDCINKKELPFDFYVPMLNLCIEYDGEFHYKTKSLGNDLKAQQEHDKIKTSYCLEKNIDLLRIPYWEFDNIEDILQKKLNKKTIPSEANGKRLERVTTRKSMLSKDT